MRYSILGGNFDFKSCIGNSGQRILNRLFHRHCAALGPCSRKCGLTELGVGSGNVAVMLSTPNRQEGVTKGLVESLGCAEQFGRSLRMLLPCSQDRERL